MQGQIELGDHVRDSISGLTGVVVARTVYLSGAVKYCVESCELDSGKMIPEYWFDGYRLEVTQSKAAELSIRGFADG